jgi:hypothetical protein
MDHLLAKLNYKGQERIAVINADDEFIPPLTENLRNIIIDKEIDPRYPYEFIILFVKKMSEIELIAPIAIHNLVADGVLWFCYPKKTSKKYKSDIDRDHGWDSLIEVGLQGVRMISLNDNWSAFRFRNTKYIKSSKK